MGSIAAQNKLVSSGNILAADGRVIKPNNVITNGPYVEIKEAIGGYIIIKANSMEEATELSTACPILNVGGGSVLRIFSKLSWIKRVHFQQCLVSDSFCGGYEIFKQCLMRLESEKKS